MIERTGAVEVVTSDCHWRHRRSTAVVAVAIASAIGMLFAPSVLDTYTVNILVRSFTYAATALTVDILWGYCGIRHSAKPPFSASAPTPLR